LNTSTFNQCLESDRYAAFVQQSSVNAQQQGVSRTPTLLLNGVAIKPPASIDELRFLVRSLPDGG